MSPKLKTYLKYHLRWQSGIFYTLPTMYLLQQVLHLNYVWTIVIFQFVGACIYWNIDNWILNKKKDGHTR